MSAETHGERLSALETWVEGHERLCAERYDSLRGDLRWILRGIVGLLLGVCGWLAVQLWNGSGQAWGADAATHRNAAAEETIAAALSAPGAVRPEQARSR